MPIRHTEKGWYWGSKGPFESRAHAVRVAQAAYSAGYRETEEEFADALKDLIELLISISSDELEKKD